jgi:phosphatidylglycerophosphatase C
MSLGADAPRTATLERVTTGVAIERLEEILADLGRPSSETLLAFDADGTLWSGDVGVDSFEALLAQNLLRPASAAMLASEAAAAGLPRAGDPTAQARILYEAYQRGAYHEDRAFRMMAWAFAGFRVEEVRAFAAEVASAARLADRLHAEILPVVAWASQREVPSFVVSASHAIVVERCLELVGLPISGVFAMRQAREGDMLLPRIEEPATYGAGKTAALRQRVGEKILLGAFGDSAFDLHLLREARLAVAVRPKPELSRAGAECIGLVELAPNVP